MKRFFPALLFSLLLSLSCHHTEVTSIDVQTVEMNPQSNLHDSATAAILAPFKDSLDKIMNEVLVVSDTAMPKERDKTETLLGNFVADVCLAKTNENIKDKKFYQANICLFNTGGLRSSLPKGNVTRGNIYELMPFDNELVVITITKENAMKLFRYIAMTGGQPAAGFQLEIKPDKTPGKITINGMPFDSITSYRVVTSDYLANGGDKMDFFKNPIESYHTGLKIRDALIEHCIAENKKGKKIGGRLDGRIYYGTN
jgi:2',3'-cyclic-nucleotide 2'-phosphodiesterase (5'-nucleotidase family)